MRLNQQTDYALRTLMILASKPAVRPSVRAIADGLGLSQNHLMKIASQLRQAGWVHAQRGRHGGLSLAIDPKSLTVRDIIIRFEGEHELVECFGAANMCKLTPECQLKGVLSAAMGTFFQELEQTSLFDLIAPVNAKNLFASLPITT